MKLLEFVALYGLILMPMGVVIFTDFWILPRINLKSNFAETMKLPINFPAGFAWLVALIVTLLLPIEIFFKAVPGFFLTVIIYIVFSYITQKRKLYHPEV